MAAQRRFEASTLAAVLAKVQKELGPNANITSAQKVRSGGVMGFFARERYEVVVDLDNPKPAAHGEPETPSASAPTSLADLVEAANATDINEIEIPGRPETIGDPLAPRTGPVSTEMESFADILSRMAFQSDMKDAPETPKTIDTDLATPSEPEPEPPSELQAPSHSEVDATRSPEPEPDVEPQADPEPEAAESVVDSEPEPEPPSELQAPSHSEVDATRSSEPASDVAESVEPQTDPEPASDVAEPEPDVEPPSELQAPPHSEVDATRSSEPAAVSEVVDLVVVDESTTDNDDQVVDLSAQEAAVAEPRTRITDHPLAQLGLPVRYIPRDLAKSDLQSALQEILEESLPKAPDIKPSRGSVIAVVGDRWEAMDVASDLAQKWGRPAEEIVLASQYFRGKGAANVLRTVRNAEDAQRSWSRRNRPTIVAIEAHPGRSQSSWAEHMLTALEPIATWGVTDATRKADDIKAWADSLGGVDALAINNIEETVSPAEVLATNLPVERVDGHNVSPAYWAVMLTERLTQA